MWSSNSHIRLLAIFIALGFYAAEAQGQSCALRLNGMVTDQHTGEAMPYVNVYERTIARATITDELGRFQLDKLCADGLHLTFSHIGCEPVDLFMDLRSDTTVQIILHHNAELLGEIEVIGIENELIQVAAQSIGKAEIDTRSDEDLTSMLTSITGLRAVQNGSTIARPVYHGMSGNRLTILNNGIAQSGQQWGSDHAPEIDASAADRLTIIQGVQTLAQNGPNLGGIVSVEMKPIPRDPHMHGAINYSFISNGAGHSLNTRIEKSAKWAAWRLTLSGKKFGDRETPDYYLANTASQQLNASLLIEKEITARWISALYLSTFNTDIGILRGSHIGNLNDLTEAFTREVPFFTESTRGYSIGNPRQAVNHHLLKLSNKIQTGLGVLDLTYAGQLNARKEYDVRRGERNDQAALDLDQSDHFLGSSMRFRPDSALSWTAGLQYRNTRNINDAETGILPLVPDYLNQTTSAYLISDWDLGKWHAAAGARFDYKNVYALTISQSLPRVIERQDLWFSSPSAVVTLRHEFNRELKLEGEAGYRQRNPEVNELFSNGLHQGVSGIEVGDPNLKNETGLLGRLSASYHINEKYFITASAYQNTIDDYIYLVPQDELRLTIRGAFPVFNYEQVDAQLRGLDLTFAAEFGKHWRMRSSYSLLKGVEQESGLALIGIPANNGTIDLKYETDSWKGFQNLRIGMSYSYVSMRDDLLTDNSEFPDRQDDSPLMGQDFLAPPAAYSLVAIDFNVKRFITKKAFNFGVKVENLLNESYRDYLDRQRYFADAMGRNVKLRVGWEF